MDMSMYRTLLQAAKADQDSGDLESAFSTYMKAHAAISRILTAQIAFRDRDNYTQLFAHVQEILRRCKDIVDHSKTRAQFASSSTSSTRARPPPRSSAPSQRSTTTMATVRGQRRTKRDVPMIPLSPLTRQSLLHNHALAQVNQRLEQTKQGSSPQASPSMSGTRDLAHLRRLIEDVRIQRSKVDAVHIQIQAVASSTLTSWDPDVLARQFTIIDTALFKDVAIPRDLVRPDRKMGPSQRCIDFENFVAHSVAHLLLQEWHSSRHPSPSSTPAGSTSSKTPPPINAAAHMIRVAFILLHVYRNFNAFMAVMRALTSPEIKRMHKVWSGVPSKTKENFRRLVTIYQEQGHVRGYKETLLQKLDAFQDVGKDAMVAIPWMRYHQDEVRSIIHSYLTGHESTRNDIVLSAPGARKLSSVTALLTQCRTNESNSFDRPEMESKAGSTNHSKNRDPVQVDGLRLPLAPVWDLISLGAGDVALHHWILSRPFLNKQQLIDESLEIEPLFNGEELACYGAPLDLEESDDSIDPSDDPAEDDSFEHVVAPEHDLEPLPLARPLSPEEGRFKVRSPVSETEVNDILNELLDDSSHEGGLFDDVDRVLARDESLDDPKKGISSRSKDVLHFLGINPESGSDEDDETSSQGGDFAAEDQKPMFGREGKGKELVKDEEIEQLMAQVKGLVRESREFEPEAAESGPQGDEGSPSLKTNFGTRRTFEPFEQGSELDFDGTDQEQPLPSTTLAEVARPLALSSLEALRKQLENLDQESGKAPEAVKEDFSHASNRSINAGSSHPSTTEASPEVDSISSDAPSLSNPFAPYMIQKPPPEPSERPVTSLGKGRRRKIQTDRIRHSPDSSEAAPVRSPPRLLFSTSPGSASDERKASIEAMAKMSLASFLAKPLPISNDHSSNVKILSTDADPVNPPLAPSLDIKDPEHTPVVTLAELDKKPLDSLLPSFAPSESNSPSTLTANATTTAAAAVTTFESLKPHVEDGMKAPEPATATKTTLASTATLNEDEYFKPAEALFTSPESRSVLSVSEAKEESIGASQPAGLSSFPEEDKGETEKEEHPGTSPKSDAEGGDGTGKAGLESSALGPAEEMTGSKTPRANRQRRRIAGGVISLPTVPKSLVAMGSNSSLSNAFQGIMDVAESGKADDNDLKENVDGHVETNASLQADPKEMDSNTEESVDTTGEIVNRASAARTKTMDKDSKPVTEKEAEILLLEAEDREGRTDE